MKAAVYGRSGVVIEEIEKPTPADDEVLIKIHAATWAGDVTKGWHSELLGCIAPGKELGALQPPELHGPQECLLKSRIALREFMDATRGEDLEIEILWRTPI